MLRTPLAALAVSVLILPASLNAQAADPDTREIAAYQLTAPTLQKVAAVHQQLVTALKSDPRVVRLVALKAEKQQLEAKAELSDAEQARLDALEGEIDAAGALLPSPLEGAQTLGDMEANIKKEPLLAASLKSAGLAPREYGTFMLALLQASIVHGLQKSGAAKDIPAQLKKQLNPENVKFVAANEAEIDRMMAGLRTVAGGQ